MKLRRLTLVLMTTAAASALAGAALADPPARVGRIAYVEGEVSFQPPETDFWTEASRNFPVSAGDSFWTGDEGRVALQVGGVRLSLDSQTALDVTNLDYGSSEFALSQGSLDVRVWRAPRGGVAISTPAGVVRLDQPGVYRIDVGAQDEDGDYPQVEVTTFDGSAAAPTADGDWASVDPGDAAILTAGYDPEVDDAQDAAIDDWARDQEGGGPYGQWAGGGDFEPGVTGSDDLVSYGDYVNDAQYGRVWFPRDVPADWAPYTYGHWAYVAPWGWTWIDDSAWGFAPFHYGRWARFDGRWGWVPGAHEAEPVYAPALVVFFGGGGWNGGAMAWAPLAPEEVYRPTYRVSDQYLRRVNTPNVHNTTIINNISVTNINVTNVNINTYKNANAAVVVRGDDFAKGAPVHSASHGAPIAPGALASAPVTTLANKPAPTAAARSGLALGGAGNPGAQGKGAGGAHGAHALSAAGVATAPPPAAKLQAVRDAVKAQPATAGKPPVIAGAHVAPPKPPTPGAGGHVFVAPAQLRNPGAQAQKPPPVVHNTQPKPVAAGAPAAPTKPLRSIAPPVGAPQNGPAHPHAGAPQTPGMQPGGQPAASRLPQRPVGPNGQPVNPGGPRRPVTPTPNAPQAAGQGQAQHVQAPNGAAPATHMPPRTPPLQPVKPQTSGPAHPASPPPPAPHPTVIAHPAPPPAHVQPTPVKPAPPKPADKKKKDDQTPKG